MLMISRKKNEYFVIQVGDELIRVTVTDIGTSSSKKQVQIGVDAPAEFKIWRSELYEAIEENKKAALAPKSSHTKQLGELLAKK